MQLHPGRIHRQTSSDGPARIFEFLGPIADTFRQTLASLAIQNEFRHVFHARQQGSAAGENDAFEEISVHAGALNFGLMAQGTMIFVPSAGTNFPNAENTIPSDDDGLFALDAFSGKRLWASKVKDNCEKSTPCTGLSFAPIGFPGAVFAGATDGYVRAYDTATGKILWRFDTAREFETLNGVVSKGGAIGRNSIMIAHGMVYVGSGFGKVRGHVLLAFSTR